MATIKQLFKKKRISTQKITRTPALENCPQKKGTCLKVFVIPPKKPNSANRRVTAVLLSNKKRITAHVPGIGHNLQKHAVVLVRGGRVKDIPGMKYRTIRGKYSLEGLHNRRRGHSKYGGKAFR